MTLGSRASSARWLDALSRTQARRPILWLLAAAVVFALALGPARRLELRPDLSALLAPDDPGVVALTSALNDLGAGAKLYVVVESNAEGGARACADDIASRVSAIGAPLAVTGAHTGLQATRSFLLSRALLFTSVADLERIHGELSERRDRAVAAAFLGELDDAATPPAPGGVASLREATASPKPSDWADRFLDGYYESPDKKAVVVLVTSTLSPGDLTRTRRAVHDIQIRVDDALGHGPCAGVRTDYAGDMITALDGHAAVSADLLDVGLVGGGLVIAVIALFFGRLRAILALVLAMVVGLGVTFGVTALAIGHLNLATGFSFSIIAGNGLNSGIILVARILEESDAGAPIADAIATAHRTTRRATLGAAVAAAASYGSLALTGFHALAEFAFVGAAGMVVYWAATYAVVPPFLVLYDRHRRSRPRKARSWLARAFEPRASRAVAALAVAVTLLGVVLGTRHALAGLVDRDLRRVRTDLVADPARARAVARAAEILGDAIDAPTLIRAREAADVGTIQRVLGERRAAYGAAPPYGKVHALADLVASDQPRKLALVSQIRDEVLAARRLGAIDDATWAEIRPTLPPADLAAFTIDDLPDDLLPGAGKEARKRVVLVERGPGRSDYDLSDLTELADALAEIRLPDGSVVRGTGRAIFFADMLRRVFGGLPRALLASFVATALVVAFTLRRRGPALLVLLSLSVGVATMALGMSVLDIRLNLFSVIAVPVALGIGVDYAINVVERATSVDAGDYGAALRGIGGSVLLCSATTTLGYAALLRSRNPAIRSFGGLSVLGEVACVTAALVALPAIAVTLGKLASRRSRPSA